MQDRRFCGTDISEGPRYKLDITFLSEIENVDLDVLRDAVPAEHDEWYDSRAIEEGLLNITNELGNLGYAFVNIVPELTTSEDQQYVNVLIRIGTAQKNFVERIEVVNNTRTLDRVIRREMDLIEGDPFNRLNQTPNMRFRLF